MPYLLQAKTKIFIAFAIISLTSCASVFNSKTQDIRIYPPPNVKVLYAGDSLTSASDHVTINVARDRTPLELSAIVDSVAVTAKIDPHNSVMYLGNIGITPLLMLVDSKSPKRWAYPTHIQINADEKNNITLTERKQGGLYLSGGIPAVNLFKFKPEGHEAFNSPGVFGLSLGLDYYYKENSFANLTFDVTKNYSLLELLNLFMPVERLSAYGVSMSNNHVVGDFSLGYGLSFHRLEFEIERAVLSSEPDVSVGSNALGLTLNSYYRPGGVFNIGINYKPYFYSFSSTEHFKYEHVISLVILLKGRL